VPNITTAALRNQTWSFSVTSNDNICTRHALWTVFQS